MFFKDRTRNKTNILSILLVVLVFLPGCERAVKGPLSVDQILNASVHLPVRYLASDVGATYGELNTVYYYFDYRPELTLITIFTAKDTEGKQVRLAQMSTYNMNGQLVNINETKGDLPAPITWARGEGGTCEVVLYAYDKEYVTGAPFQSCLFWFDQDLYQYKLYTVWSEEQAVDFVNSLSVLKTVSE